MEASKSKNTTLDLKQLEDEFKQLQLSLPKQNLFGYPYYLYQNFWCPSVVFETVIAFQASFQAPDTDIILASLPKTGTTWSKALIYTILNRTNLHNNNIAQTLPTKNPHELVLRFEYNVYNKINENQPNLAQLPPPRIFSTHVSYLALPNSTRSSKCRIVYICRNPIDTFVSSWHFYLQHDMNKHIKPDKQMLEEYVDKLCKGVTPYGPYDEHMIGYWKERMENKDKVLFLEYEGLKKEPKAHLKMLAEFLGCPFSDEEEKENVIDNIIELCSLKSLKEMDVNKSGKLFPWFGNNTLFRKGEVGDWSNDLTPSMAKRIEEILQDEPKKAGFSFKYYQTSPYNDFGNR